MYGIGYIALHGHLEENILKHFFYFKLIYYCILPLFYDEIFNRENNWYLKKFILKVLIRVQLKWKCFFKYLWSWKTGFERRMRLVNAWNLQNNCFIVLLLFFIVILDIFFCINNEAIISFCGCNPSAIISMDNFFVSQRTSF